MCDEQLDRIDFAREHFSAYCAWVYWRAPRFVHMQPSGNTRYDPDTAWEREDPDKTETLLQGLTERILDAATFKVRDLAGEACVSLASTPPAAQQPTPAEALPQPRDVGHVGEMNNPKADPTDPKQLPPKKAGFF